MLLTLVDKLLRGHECLLGKESYPMLYTTETIVVDGVEREYILHIPVNVPANPDLVISCHGGGSSGSEWWNRHWHRQTDKGFIIACPSARLDPHGETHWVGIGDKRFDPSIDEHADERFILAVINHLKTSHGVKQVFMSGFSSGSKMTHHMRVTHSGLFKAFAMTGHGPCEEMLVLPAPELRPVRISFGTLDDNFSNPADGLLDGQESFEYFRGLLPVQPVIKRTTQAGRKTTARTLTYEVPTGTLQTTLFRSMPHRWAKTSMGDPYYEDDAQIEFWRTYSTMQ